MAETYRCSWDDATRLGVYTFFTVYCYWVSKTERQNAMVKAEYAKMKTRHTRH